MRENIGQNPNMFLDGAGGDGHKDKDIADTYIENL